MNKRWRMTLSAIKCLLNPSLIQKEMRGAIQYEHLMHLREQFTSITATNVEALGSIIDLANLASIRTDPE